MFEQWGLWESVIAVLVFSIVVIVADEWLHARRRREHDRQAGGRGGD